MAECEFLSLRRKPRTLCKHCDRKVIHAKDRYMVYKKIPDLSRFAMNLLYISNPLSDNDRHDARIEECNEFCH